MSLETSVSESGEKDVNECMFVGKMYLTSAVDEGGGGGGQSWEENVLKSIRELGELLILP